MSLTVEQGKELIIDFCRQYPLAAKVKYVVRESQEEMLYATTKTENATIEQAGKIYGAYFPGRGIAGFAANNFRDEAHFRRTLRHELIGHFGINTFTEKEKQQLLTAIIAAKDEPTISPLWQKIESAYPTTLTDTQKAEELFAFVCEDIKPNQSLDKKFGEQAFINSCQNQTQKLTLQNVVAIASMVADGMADNSRQQQIFPKSDIDQFQRDITMRTNRKPFHEEVAQQIITKLEEFLSHVCG